MKRPDLKDYQTRPHHHYNLGDYSRDLNKHIDHLENKIALQELTKDSEDLGLYDDNKAIEKKAEEYSDDPGRRMDFYLGAVWAKGNKLIKEQEYTPPEFGSFKWLLTHAGYSKIDKLIKNDPDVKEALSHLLRIYIGDTEKDSNK